MIKYKKDKFYKMELELGYSHDTEEYKNHRDYFDTYCPYCRENRLIPVTKDFFLEDLKTRINKENAQGYLDMLHEGKTIGECNEKYNFTFDESSIVINSALSSFTYLKKEVDLP